jgi:hypothetical protein
MRRDVGGRRDRPGPVDEGHGPVWQPGGARERPGLGEGACDERRAVAEERVAAQRVSGEQPPDDADRALEKVDVALAAHEPRQLLRRE